MKIVIVGGGPSGLMCAYQSSQGDNEIIIFDSNEKLGKKLYITGKGRCNVTNLTNVDNFLKNVVNNSKFLYSAINAFSPQDTVNFFEANNTPLKVERGNRVFPQSDKASDITKTFYRLLDKPNVKICLNEKVLNVEKFNNAFCIKTNTQNIICDAVVIATGGKSYSSTGSTGDGYKFAKEFGHSIVDVKPALVPIVLKDYDGNLSGLSLKNINVAVYVSNKKFEQFGEMLFTHNGVSGPVILKLSSLINRFDLKNVELVIDLKPALSYKMLNERLIRDFSLYKLKTLKNYLKELLPSSLIDEFIKKGHFDKDQKICTISKSLREEMVNLLKNFKYIITRLEGFEYAIITSGGISVKEINPKNMESKFIKNLFFIGEILDVDAFTGGFNIQIALSTGYVAGKYLCSLV